MLSVLSPRGAGSGARWCLRSVCCLKSQLGGFFGLAEMSPRRCVVSRRRVAAFTVRKRKGGKGESQTSTVFVADPERETELDSET